MGRSRSPRRKSERKRSRSRERKRRRRSTSSSSDSGHHKRRRDKKSSGHGRRSRSRSRERHSKHHKQHRSHDRHRKRSESPPPAKEKVDGKKDSNEDPTSNLTGAEKVRARLKMLLDQQEKKKKEEEQMKMERILTVPSSKQIASIEKEGFHQQRFESALRATKTTTKDKSSSETTPFPTISISEQDHDSAIFGDKDVTVSNVSKPPEEKKSQPAVVSATQLSSSEKKARWLEKLNKMRSKYSKPPSDEPTEPLT
ncbi:serine/Arginine-related protein 53-like [Dysidea avara]|uniref:serine/Arginine-related protein 53-like n=1 Tax=Dysidea avara TaxID=196820 RepID=UPI0033223911